MTRSESHTEPVGRTANRRPDEGPDLENRKDRAKRQTHEATEQVEQAAHEAAEQIKRHGKRMAREARDRANEAALHQKDRAAHKLGDVGDALGRAASKLDEEDDPRLAEYAHSAADAACRFAESLEHKDLDDLGRDLSKVARDRPELFLGAALAGGLMLGRFLRSSSHHSRDDSPEPTGGAVDTSRQADLQPATPPPAAPTSPSRTAPQPESRQPGSYEPAPPGGYVTPPDRTGPQRPDQPPSTGE